MSDPYVYPNSDILKNIPGHKDRASAEQFERLMSGERMRQMSLNIETGKLAVECTAKSYLDLHREIFRDVYDWAGQIRQVDISKGEMFCRHQFIAQELERRFAALNAESNLTGLTPKRFAERAAEHLAELNAIHPFREGNGRTQRLFLKALAQHAGHPLAIKAIDPKAWHRASVESFHGKLDTMQSVIRTALDGTGTGQSAGEGNKEGESTKKQSWKERRAALGEGAGRKPGYRRGR